MYFKLVYQDAVDQSYQQNLFKAANTDSLTQLYNKRYFMESLEKEFSFTRRSLLPLSLIMLDIDFFKQINDNHGHVAGDKILKLLGSILASQTRLENIACRFGGEEFAIVLRGATTTQAKQVAERIRATVQNQKVSNKNKDISFTISMGVATFTGTNFNSPEEFLSRADELLYQAKQNGRNQTMAEAA
ncbi:GGDEF domain-containing protein [bacterium]|nr:GGDEF domain-containing protein [bacterium]